MALASEPTPSRSADAANAAGDSRTSGQLGSPKADSNQASALEAQDGNRKKVKKNNKCNIKATGDKENAKSKKAKKKPAATNENKTNSHSSARDKVVNRAEAKPKPLLVEELKLFQNNNLLNQEDPIQQLQTQLNELIRNDDNPRPRPFSVQQQQQQMLVESSNRLSYNQQQQQQQLPNSTTTTNHINGFIVQQNSTNLGTFGSEGDDVLTVKKGVLWQQQNYEKFHQRLFSRWKKRYFILTTDYLVCFKRTPCKVGRSEMGKFLYKTSLNDITNIEWLKPKKSDKGAIVLHLNGQFNLFLWSKQNLDEWMFMIKESIERNKIRRACLMQNGLARLPTLENGSHQVDANNGDLYENTNQIGHQQQLYANQANGVESSAIFAAKPNEEPNNNMESVDFVAKEHQSLQADRSHSISSPASKARPELSRSQEEQVVKRLAGGEATPTCAPTSNGSGRERNKSAASSSSSSQATLESDKANPIERESLKGNTTIDDCADSADGKKVDIARASGRGRKAMMINDDVSQSKEAGRERNGRPDQSSSSSSSSPNSAPKQASARGKAPRLFQHDETRNDLSSAPADRLPDEMISRPRDEAEQGSPGGSDIAKTRRSSSERRSRERADKIRNEDETCKVVADSEQRDSSKSKRQVGGVASPISQVRPSGKLIRRDDSWQSLVSLARIGKVAPTAAQVAQRSLYAQHIMPNNNDESASPIAHNRHQHMINGESSFTPIRRHQSVQASRVQTRLRPFPAGLQAASLDLPSPPMQLANSKPAHTTSYQQKLLQLQLMHNSNNVDYIRSNGSDTNDYQVYGSNHYGYSSMRSNLKSAASEFSFIRPHSASRNQSTLPHQHHQQQLLLHYHNQQQQQQQQQQGADLGLDNSHGNTRQQQAIRSNQFNLPNGSTMVADSNNNNCLSPMTKQFLVNPLTGERMINQGLLAASGGNLVQPPMRELPLKPNKKRQTQNNSATKGNHANLNGSNLPKSSSLTSSIACFFRRAFSRRSAKGSKKRSRLAESCSSSLGAFEDGVTIVPVVPSAFSTGSKSVDGRNKDFNNNSNHQQSQRMVDMIEAFTNRALLPAEQGVESARSNGLSAESEQATRQYSAFNMDFNVAPQLAAIPPTPNTPNQLRRTINHFGSPMHKSNSISATMGLSLAHNLNSRRAFLQDNELMAGNACEESSSPMLMRSTKVMSAHLTPLMLHRESAGVSGTNQQFILSPRNSKIEQMPRPSSIYGQPSMISSPIISRDERNQFGAHRNSLHNHQFGDKAHNSAIAAGLELRRYNQMMKVPFLDTTREVAEELASPTTETPTNQAEIQSPQCGRYFIKRDRTFDIISASPSSGSVQQHHQQAALVNPILQSPTMDTIYDNHPMLNPMAESLSSYSHYDNNMSHYQRQGSSGQRLSSSGGGGGSSMSSSKTQYSIRQQPQTDYQPTSLEDHYSRRLANVKPQSYIPSHQSRLTESGRFPTVADMMMSNKKPSAIVAPSTPDHNSHISLRGDASLIGDQLANRHSPNSPLIQSQSRSPMMSRRAGHLNQQSHYQQSPLVSQQTRVLSKADGVQATIVRDKDPNSEHLIGQPAVSIAGAPGINLEPSLAASLLRGTNIDAYESSTFDRSAPSDDLRASSKTFLVSTRLSKSMASSQSSSNYDGSASSMSKDEQGATTNGEGSLNKTTILKSTKDDELSATSSSSRSMSSSIGSRSLRARKGYKDGDKRGSQLEHSSSTDTQGSKGLVSNRDIRPPTQTRQKGCNKRSPMRCEKESSSERSEGTTSHRSSLDREVDERIWITSKLVE